MAHTTMRRNGGWTIELNEPLLGQNGPITELVLAPIRAEHTIRWAEGQIESTLGLISDLSGVPEVLLRQLISVDFDRVMTAYYTMIPPLIKKDFEAGKRPLSTPTNEFAPPVVIPDQQDPRFPHVPGPVQRVPPEKLDPIKPAEDTAGFSVAAPETMKAAS